MHSLTKRRSWAPLLALGLLILSGCGASAGAGATSSPTATATATTLPTPTATPSPAATPSPVTLPCANSPFIGDAHALADSDFLIVGPSLMNLAYPGVQLHEVTPSAPLLLGTRSSLPYASVAVNPSLDTGYQVFLCNGSTSRSHQVTSLGVRIESLAPFTGKLLEWPACQFAYSRSSPGAGGCGGGYAYDERVDASFPAGASAGTTEPTALQYAGPVNAEDAKLPPYGPLPVTVGPGRGISINVALKLTDPAATYSFSVGVSLDGAPPVFSQPTDPVLLAPVAQTWTGAACQAPTMQAQIPPATNPPTYYICPAA